jgi:uncharacterized Zn finger protein
MEWMYCPVCKEKRYHDEIVKTPSYALYACRHCGIIHTGTNSGQQEGE